MPPLFNITSECLEGWTVYRDKCYRVYQEPIGLTWLEAEDICQSVGGHLISIETEQEMLLIHEFLTNILRNTSYLHNDLLGQLYSQETIDFYIGMPFKTYIIWLIWIITGTTYMISKILTI